MDLLEGIQRKPRICSESWSPLCSGARLEELGVFTLQGVLRPLPVPEKICLLRKVETDLFTGLVAIRQGGDGFKLKEGGFRLDKRK